VGFDAVGEDTSSVSSLTSADCSLFTTERTLAVEGAFSERARSSLKSASTASVSGLFVPGPSDALWR